MLADKWSTTTYSIWQKGEAILEHTYPEEPQKYGGYYEARHEEITVRLTSPTATPLIARQGVRNAWLSPDMSFLHRSAAFLTGDVLCIHAAYFTTPASTSMIHMFACKCSAMIQMPLSNEIEKELSNPSTTCSFRKELSTTWKLKFKLTLS